ncbi:MAG: hypothetical protein BWY15_00320 [Firmicutes bacterium ADurb.Bin193]|nr:MAG: hypothetical protein BWY15_00320 [Firmicutes bacterium ADurb.Bin193]
MKKIVSLVTALAVMLTVAFPVFAEDKGEQVEKLLLKIKSVIDIPDSMTVFNSNMRTDENGITYWSFNWSLEGKSYFESQNISVEITDDGYITSYSKYNGDYKYSEIVQLPNISKAEAEKIVKEFILKVCPHIEGQIEWKEPNIYDASYYYSFKRTANGIPTNFNDVSFSVNGITGEVVSYFSNWNTKLEFPSAEKAIPVEKAKELYQKNMPLNLEYRIRPDGYIYLQYTTSREQGNKYLNAITGQLEEMDYYYAPYMSQDRAYMDEAMSSKRTDITPVERKEIDSVAGTITTEEAEKILRSIPELNFDESYSLSSSNLSQHKPAYSDESVFYLSLYFARINKTEGLTDEQMKMKIAAGDTIGSANATFDAKSGELLSFWSNDWSRPVDINSAAESKIKKEDSKKTADAFLAKYYSEKMKSVKYIDNMGRGSENQHQYSRIENGIFFDYDGLSVGIDGETGKISNFNCSWNKNIAIPPAGNVIGLEAAHKVAFEKIGFEFQYIFNKKAAVLVYRLRDDKPPFIDAVSGEILNYEGNPYKETIAPKYNDIAGHFCEQAVLELLNVGVFLNAESFMPDSNIAQKDYLLLLSKLGKQYYDRDNIDELYKFLINSKVMDENEKNPEGTVTREDAVKFLLRSLGYRKFAEIKGIFVCDFADVSDISPDLIGYATIAKGLGFIEGSEGKFKPKDILTKGEAAVIIYNCLKKNS